jgi:hypothetical protein
MVYRATLYEASVGPSLYQRSMVRMTNPCTCKAEHWQPHANSCPVQNKPTTTMTHVEELRHVAAMESCSWDYAQKLMRSSADEIERLRAEVVGIQAAHAEDYAEGQEEIKRLRAIIDSRDKALGFVDIPDEPSENRLEAARGAARHKAWCELLELFPQDQRQHVANLMAHDWKIDRVHMAHADGRRTDIEPPRSVKSGEQL